MSVCVSVLSLVFLLQTRVKQVGLIGSQKDSHRCQNVNACWLEATDELIYFCCCCCSVPFDEQNKVHGVSETEGI